MIDYLGKIDVTLCLLFIAVYGVYFLLKSVRWRVVLHSIVQAPTADLIPVTVTGYAANVLVPHSGELLRSYQVGRRYKVSSTSVLASIVVERMFDLMSLLFLTAIIIGFSHEGNPYLENTAYIISAGIAVALGLALLALKNTQQFQSVAGKLLFWLPRRYRKVLLSYVTSGIAGLTILENPGKFFHAGILSVLQWILILFCNWLSLAAVGITAEPIAAMMLVMLMVIGIALPTAPGYVGTTQVCFLATGAVFDWDTAQTVSASIVYNVLMTVPLMMWATWYSVGLPGSRGWHLKFFGKNKIKKHKNG